MVLGLELCTDPTNVETMLQRLLLLPLQCMAVVLTIREIILGATAGCCVFPPWVPLLAMVFVVVLRTASAPWVLLLVTWTTLPIVVVLTPILLPNLCPLLIVCVTSAVRLDGLNDLSPMMMECDSNGPTMEKSGPLAAVLTKAMLWPLMVGSSVLRRDPEK